MFGRTKSASALSIAVAVVAVGSLAGAPTAGACLIDPDGNCLVSHVSRIPTPQPKPKAKHAKPKQAPIHHAR